MVRDKGGRSKVFFLGKVKAITCHPQKRNMGQGRSKKATGGINDIF
jgi:hypothetical protein